MIRCRTATMSAITTTGSVKFDVDCSLGVDIVDMLPPGVVPVAADVVRVAVLDVLGELIVVEDSVEEVVVEGVETV